MTAPVVDRRDDTCPVDPSVSVPAFVIVWLAASIASSLPLILVGNDDADSTTSIPVLAVSLLLGWTTYLAGTWVVSKRFGSGDARADFALRFRPIDAAALVVGAVTQVVAVPLVYVPLRSLRPDVFDDDALSETARDLVERADGLLPLLVVLVVFGAPLVEEIVYRGLLQRPLLARFPAPLVVVGVAAIFALIHFRPVEYPGLFVAGLVFGICAWRTGRVGTAIAAHVGFNAVGILFAL